MCADVGTLMVLKDQTWRESGFKSKTGRLSVSETAVGEVPVGEPLSVAVGFWGSSLSKF